MSELIYRLEDRPPLPQTPLCRLSASAGDVCGSDYAGLLIAQALGLSAHDTSGLSRYVAVRFRAGLTAANPYTGAGRLRAALYPGTSFNFVAPLIIGMAL